MAIITYSFDNFNELNPYNKYFITIKDETYIFTVRWNEYCDCAFLDIHDYEDNPIVSGKALVNNLEIRHHKLPYIFYFIHLNGETYEPTIDNLADEFAIGYNDEIEVV